MKWFWFPVAVVATSLALVAALAVVFVLPARTALASTLGVSGFASNGPWSGGTAWHDGPWGHGSGVALPPELQGLLGVPADQRFGHFVGAQISLKDKDNKPLTVAVTPGTVTAASATSLTVAVNDGTTKMFSLNDQTMLPGHRASVGGQTSSSSPNNGDTVVVVTLNNSTTATAVVAGGPQGFGWSGPGGPWGSAENAR